MCADVACRIYAKLKEQTSYGQIVLWLNPSLIQLIPTVLNKNYELEIMKAITVSSILNFASRPIRPQSLVSPPARKPIPRPQQIITLSAIILCSAMAHFDAKGMSIPNGDRAGEAKNFNMQKHKLLLY